MIIHKNAESGSYPEAVKILADNADVAYFAKDWDKYRGCCMEHEAAVRYEIGIIHHFDDDVR